MILKKHILSPLLAGILGIMVLGSTVLPAHATELTVGSATPPTNVISTVPSANPATAATATTAAQDALAAQAAQAQAAQAVAATPGFAGKKVSILGDSISTYSGYITPTYSQYYPTQGTLTNVAQTWWMQMIAQSGMTLCTNASCVNTLVSGNSLDPAGRVGCSFARVANLKSAGVSPDVIVIYMGTNDLTFSAPLGTYQRGKVIQEGNVSNFADAYDLMLTKIQVTYPNAKIYCLTCLPVTRWTDDARKNAIPFTNNLGLNVTHYNAVIKQVAAGHGVSVIDIHSCGLTTQNAVLFTEEGTHPNAPGMQLVANYIKSAMKY